MNKLIGALIITLATCSYARAESDVCAVNAKKYVKAFSQISFNLLKEGQAKLGTAKLISTAKVSNGTQEIFEVESTGSNATPIRCLYEIKMLKNITNDCWAESLLETECSG